MSKVVFARLAALAMLPLTIGAANAAPTEVDDPAVPMAHSYVNSALYTDAEIFGSTPTKFNRVAREPAVKLDKHKTEFDALLPNGLTPSAPMDSSLKIEAPIRAAIAADVAKKMGNAKFDALLPDGLPASRTMNDTLLGADEIKASQAADVAREKVNSQYSVYDKLSAAVDDVSLTAHVFRAMDKAHQEVDPGYGTWMANNWGTAVGDFAQNHDEFDTLVNTKNWDDLEVTKKEILASRARKDVYAQTNGQARLYGLAGIVIDPIVLVMLTLVGLWAWSNFRKKVALV